MNPVEMSDIVLRTLNQKQNHGYTGDVLFKLVFDKGDITSWRIIKKVVPVVKPEKKPKAPEAVEDKPKPKSRKRKTSKRSGR